MSAGGVFTIITNDGKADKMLTATALLLQRIADIACANRALGRDPTPQLAELEKTHVLYVNAHFKPYVAIGFEYQKVRSSAGVANWGTSVQFSIPQFGDFFHDMVLHLRIAAVSATAQNTPLQTAGTQFPFDTVATEPSVASGPAAGTMYNLVDPAGNVVVAGTTAAAGANVAVSYRNLTRYVEYPGLRMIKNTKFEVNGNPLDQYDTETAALLHKFTIMPHKTFGTNVLLGQENPLQGFTSLRIGTAVDVDTKSGPAFKTPAGITNSDAAQSNQTVDLFSTPTNLVLATTVSQTLNLGVTATVPGATPVASATLNKDIARYQTSVLNGPQTPKPIQAPLDLWIKTRFWFNEDVRLSVPSVAIPYGQRFITFDLNTADQLIQEYPGIYVETTVVASTPQINNNVRDINPNTFVRTYAPFYTKGGITTPSILTSELFVNNIFVNPEVHDIFIKRIGFSLIRVFRTHRQSLTTNKDQILLSQLKWPIEYLFVGFRPQYNASTSNNNMWRDWHRMTRQIDTWTFKPDLGFTVPQEVFGADAASLTEVKKGGWMSSSVDNVQPDTYFLPVPTIDTASLSAHGVTLYDSFPDVFFSAYEATHYGGSNVTSTDDPGALFITFSLFPGSYQPSGHINISRAREFYLSWTSSYISADTPCDAIVVAKAINFLLISDGSAMLRYTT